MEFGQDIDWDLFDNFVVKQNYMTLDQNPSHPTSAVKGVDHYEINGPEENISTSISDIEVDQGIIRPNMPALACPECLSKVKAFQYNDEMAMFMCQNIQVI